jgi:hypothetical protein
MRRSGPQQVLLGESCSVAVYGTVARVQLSVTLAFCECVLGAPEEKHTTPYDACRR